MESFGKRGGFPFKRTGLGNCGPEPPESYVQIPLLSKAFNHIKVFESTVAAEKRDGRRMTRLPCESRLSMRPCLETRTLSVSIHHKWHPPYEDIELPPLVKDLINSRVSNKTPSEIYVNSEIRYRQGI